MDERKPEGVWWPWDLYNSRKLSFQEKALMIEIRGLGFKEPVRGCYARNKHFAEQFELSTSRVSELINGLVAKGLVRAEMLRQGEQIIERRLFLTPRGHAYWTGVPYSKNTHTPPSEKAETLSVNSEAPPSEKAKENSTKVNNTTEESTPETGDGCDGEKPKPKREKATKPKPTEGFDAFWAAYPRRVGKDNALKSWSTALAGKPKTKTSPAVPAVTAEEIMAGLESWTRVWELRQTGLEYIPHASTWINQRRFTDDLRGEIENGNRSNNRPANTASTDRLESGFAALMAVSNELRERGGDAPEFGG